MGKKCKVLLIRQLYINNLHLYVMSSGERGVVAKDFYAELK